MLSVMCLSLFVYVLMYISPCPVGCLWSVGVAFPGNTHSFLSIQEMMIM